MQLADSNKISMSRPSSSPGVGAVEFCGPDAQAPALIFVSTYGYEREKHGAIDPCMNGISTYGCDREKHGSIDPWNNGVTTHGYEREKMGQLTPGRVVNQASGMISQIMKACLRRPDIVRYFELRA